MKFERRTCSEYVAPRCWGSSPVGQCEYLDGWPPSGYYIHVEYCASFRYFKDISEYNRGFMWVEWLFFLYCPLRFFLWVFPSPLNQHLYLSCTSWSDGLYGDCFQCLQLFVAPPGELVEMNALIFSLLGKIQYSYILYNFACAFQH